MRQDTNTPANTPSTAPKQDRIFQIIICCVILYCCLIIGKALLIIGPQRADWLAKVDKLKMENKVMEPLRGNIYSADGELMASSIPLYKVYIDFKADGLSRDSLMNNLPALCRQLEKKFGEHSEAGWRAHILKGYNSGSRNFRLIRRAISYTERKELKTLPFLKYPPNKSGVKFEEVAQRKKPYGSLASRTIGDVYGDMAKGGKNGLELAYDSLLRGTPGLGTRRKVAGTYYTVPVREPVNGADITTTIDVNIQDIVQTALMEKLQEIDAESGTAVVMEVKTGEVKAISNLGRVGAGRYEETKNYAISDQSEPGSTFKVASMIVALDKGIVSPLDTVDVGNGIYMYRGARMTDHNWHHGGYGKITAAQAIWYSSNIGVAKIILKGFENNPAEYVDALYEMGMNKRFDMGIPGAGYPIIRHPNDTTNRRLWSKTSLPWMSFGYETQIPPIYTLTFFNAIANDGCMVKPYFVKRITKDGHVIEKYSTEVIKSSICKSSTLKEIRKMLEGVVENGTAKMIRSDRIKLAGKTGTAQISKGALGYQAGGKTHQVSFCGYFPADNPIYSCIVVVRSPRNGAPSGGGMSGMVFKHIAERTYARKHVAEIERDTTHTYLPHVKNGNYKDLAYLFDKLDIECDDTGKPWDWTTARTGSETIALQEQTYSAELMPQTVGMGAKDAVFLVERTGARVHIEGRGRVWQQSKPAGQKVRKGEMITLNLK
jgi:cell division protein FtsI (penicillin-binding protein 3)